jgi:hypothetical protein
MNGSKEIEMNQHRFSGNRKFRGEVRGTGASLAIEALDIADGVQDQIADRIHEPSGFSNEEAARQLDGFLERNRNWNLSHQ